ncbi:MAG TPA: MJ0042-type zinc finger domain-containing protein [Xanthobacteraceae bacterium]|nr:MJ0042-type zinc finger domain-containing protein [Xanthobacteraceae bacterium]
MLIVCPKCGTTYRVDHTALGVEGRQVRCARCMTIWRASTDDAPPMAAATAPRQEAAEAAVRSANGLAPATPVAPVVIAEAPSVVPAMEAQAHPPDAGIIEPLGEDIETLAARRERRQKLPKTGRGRWRLPRLSTVVIGLAASLAALITCRTAVVQTFPQTASLFAAMHLPVNLRGLDFADVKSSEEFDQGVPVLVVDGKIVNLTNRILDVPRLRIAVRNAAGHEVYAWTALAQSPILGPRDSLPFRTRLASPPGDARDVVVRFFTKRDRMAGFQ